MSKKLQLKVEKFQKRYPELRRENITRTLLQFYGLSYKKQSSFPNRKTHYEIFFTPKRLTEFSVLTFLQPKSPFSLIDTGRDGWHTLLYEGEFVDMIRDYEQREFDYNKEEPFYFYVQEVNGDLVLKLNPVQLCDFFLSQKGVSPCEFCFRKDAVSRFRNISAKDLISKIWKEEKKRDNLKTLMAIDELSIVTGSYATDEEYLKELEVLVTGIKSKIRNSLRVVVGSHEGKTKKFFKKMKDFGVTVFAFPIESLDDEVRKSQMKNRKGKVSNKEILDGVKDAVDVFGPKGVIVRLVVGMGDKIDKKLEDKVKEIVNYAEGKHGEIYWNLNQYMPFTHYHWEKFKYDKPFDLDYLFKYYSIINSYVPLKYQQRFKVSP